MARTRVFVSSTYYDLKHVRAALEVFLESMGFDAVLSERGNIPYDHLTPLDESCYREVSNCDILVLIIGGVTGSQVSSERPQREDGDKRAETELERHYRQYNSITKREFEQAQKQNIQAFVLVDAGVHAEYQTFKKNRENKTIHYAHANNVSVFHLLDQIYDLQKNNAVQPFDRIHAAQMWLREQLSGLFRELLRERSQSSEFVALRDRIEELKRSNESIEKLVRASLEPESDHSEVIEHQHSDEERYQTALQQIKGDRYCQNLIKRIRLSLREFTGAFLKAESLDSFIGEVGQLATWDGAVDAARAYFTRAEAMKGINRLRQSLGIKPFESTLWQTVIELPNGRSIVFNHNIADIADVVLEYCHRSGVSMSQLTMTEDLKKMLIDSGLAKYHLTEEKFINASENVVKRIQREVAKVLDADATTSLESE